MKINFINIKIYSTAKINDNQDVLLCLKDIEKTYYSEVALIAIKYPNAVATSSSCKRLFSKSNKVIIKRRNRLSPDRVINNFF